MTFTIGIPSPEREREERERALFVQLNGPR
jgi:hypothetical protein